MPAPKRRAETVRRLSPIWHQRKPRDNHAMNIAELWQFPVKGLGGSKISTAKLTAGGYFPNDRRFALSTGTARVAEATPGEWLKKAYFLQLMTHDALADYTASFRDDARHPCLTITHRDGTQIALDPTTPAGCAQLEAFCATAFADALSGTPRLMAMQDQAYSDQPTALISLASTASLGAFAMASNTPASNRRFRINIIMTGDVPFAEQSLIGKRLQCGTAVIDVKAPVGRCAAINVNPETSRRDSDHLAMMRQTFGHSILGIFAEVVTGGKITVGDQIKVI